MNPPTAALAAPPAAHDITTPADGGVRITAVGLTTVHAHGATALDDVHLTIGPGQLTAVIGPSGAGKTTLLGALAGISPAQHGTVTFHGAAGVTGDAGSPELDGAPTRTGYVPQDDILHTELPLRRTLGHAAALRLDWPTAARWAAVDDAMEILGLADHADVRVGSLSGGQRKRASIACEILARPGVCFLDEPTSGLDPSASAGLVACLRRMSARGSTVVFTTHSVEDIERADRVVVLAPGGRLAAIGAPADVLDHLGAATFAELYEHLTTGDHPIDRVTDRVADRQTDPAPASRRAMPVPPRSARPARRPNRGSGPTRIRQWRVLTRRSAETLLHNRLTLAILLGSPAAVIAMFAVLFRPGGFEPGTGDPTSAVMVAYWLAFAGFFFGLTFGLLQICVEGAVLRREHHAGVSTGAYLLSKLALLTPFLLVINATMVVVLRGLDRLPALPADAYLHLFATMALNAVAALCLGLLASAAVTSTAQAALALPMLCFPAVLFAGAIVPVPVMASTGRAIAALMSNRWAFEAIAGHLDVAALTDPASPHAGLGASDPATYWALLAIFILVLGWGAYATVRVRAAGADR